MRARRYFVAGLLIWVPIGVTILVFKVLLDLMDRALFLVPVAYRPETLLGFHIPGLGAVLALLLLFLTGVLAANLFGKSVVHWYERLLNRIQLEMDADEPPMGLLLALPVLAPERSRR